MRAKRRRLSTEVLLKEPTLDDDSNAFNDLQVLGELALEPDSNLSSNLIFNDSQVEDISCHSSFETKEYADPIDLCTSSQNPNNVKEDIHSFLISWSLKHHISHVAINDLLRYLQTVFPKLPSDARTLLKTCRDIETKTVFPGEYHHFGVKYCLEKLHSKNQRTFLTKNLFELDINIDGLPLAKSSNSQVYPILCKLKDNVC